ncbi:MAG: hypothetical protein WDM80_10870 [Limisphaerales bacterium]
MNRDEAKAVLLLYRHGTADKEDPQIAEALALAQSDQELKDWLVIHCARQFVLREQFQRIAVPVGLKEQIISEQAAGERDVPSGLPKLRLVPVLALILLSGVLAVFWLADQRERDDTLVVFQTQMAGIALRGYGMDLTTNDPVQIRAYLAKNGAPSDFILPGTLKQIQLAGCALEGWQGVKVSMVCFRSSRSAPDVSSDVWLFVVDKASVKKLSAGPIPQIAPVNRLITATWVQGDKLYFLGTTGDAQTLQEYL